MRRRALMLLLLTVALGACAGRNVLPQAGFAPGLGPGFAGQPGGLPRLAGGGQVAILLPLTGPNAGIGEAMLKAAQLALDPAAGAPPLDAIDTGGTPQGAAAGATQAVAAGAGLILGPLTAVETAAAAPVARRAGVAVLAFTNDPSQAQPGVWTLGITPAQQVRRLAEAGQAQGHDHMAALLPDSPFGHALGDALGQTTTALGLAPPVVRTYGPAFAAINVAARDLSDYANRRGPMDAQIRAARARGDAEGRRLAADIARQSPPPPPFDTLLLAETGEKLTEVLSLLPYYDIDPPRVQLLGPSLWGADPARLAGERGIAGAWFAGPDPAVRGAFAQAYSAKFGADPPAVADIAFDAATIARTMAQTGGVSFASLTRADGFAGADGMLTLQPDGGVRRGLAVFQIDHGGAHVVAGAPAPVGPTPGT